MNEKGSGLLLTYYDLVGFCLQLPRKLEYGRSLDLKPEIRGRLFNRQEKSVETVGKRRVRIGSEDKFSISRNRLSKGPLSYLKTLYCTRFQQDSKCVPWDEEGEPM